MKKVVLTFGLIAGAVLSGMMLLTIPFQDRIGTEHSLLIGYATMVVAFVTIYFGIRSYRDNVAGGVVKFGRALAMGLMITAIATVCYVTTWEIYFFNFAPDFGDKYAAYAIDQARKSGASPEKIAATTKEMEQFKVSYKNPLINIAYTSIEPLPVGVFFSLVAAGVLSRKRRATTA
jgi:hypothetical protein